MQRKIKFRVWDGVDYMSNPFTLFDMQSKAIQFASTVTVMQFTGLFDKTGKEIYEGDIVQWVVYDDYLGTENIEKGSVFYHEKEARFRIRQYPEFEIFRFGDQIEIIGNIYANPDLYSK